MADGIVFLPSFHEAIKDLPDAVRLEAYDAVIRYGLYGEVVEMSPVVRSLFTLMRPVVDSSQRKHRAAKENGNMPPKDPNRPRGRPRKNQTENQTKNQEKEIDSEREKDKEMEKDSAIESDTSSSLSPPENQRQKTSDVLSIDDLFSPFSPGSYEPLEEDAFEKQREAQLAKLRSRS